MTYRFLRMYVGLFMKLFIKDLKINGKENIPKDRAVLFAAFHSNSFLDAMILDILADRPIWSLTRGDAFKNKYIRMVLEKMYMIPIFRISEGKENLGKNDETFDRCLQVFKQKGQVQIFSEGLCKNQIEMLPLKKGTARIVLQSWNEGVDVAVIPTAINYSKFASFGKKVVLNFDKPIEKENFDSIEVSGANVLTFNEKLGEGIKNAITRDFNFSTINSVLYHIMFLINFPLYFVLTLIIKARTKGTVYFDSVFLASLIIAVPLYWILLGSLLWYFL